MPLNCAMPIVPTRALFHAATPRITSTATAAILNWRRNPARLLREIAGSNVSPSVVQKRQREGLKVSLAGIDLPMPRIFQESLPDATRII